MFMTPEMQFMAATYGQVVFLDAIKSKISLMDWPFYPIAVIDEENHLYVIAFCLCVQESNEAYKWILDSIKSISHHFSTSLKSQCRTDLYLTMFCSRLFAYNWLDFVIGTSEIETWRNESTIIHSRDKF